MAYKPSSQTKRENSDRDCDVERSATKMILSFFMDIAILGHLKIFQTTFHSLQYWETLQQNSKFNYCQNIM